MVLIWEYAGARGPGIAEHYAKHLREFAVRESLDGVAVEVEQACVSMTVQDSDGEAIAKALKPHRIVREP